MKKSLIFLLLADASALATAQTLECSDRIVGVGSTQAEVAALCGQPAQVDHKSVFRSVAAGQSNLTAGTTIEVQLDTWTYNFGPDKLMQRIRFEDGTVVRIESLGYGY